MFKSKILRVAYAITVAEGNGDHIDTTNISASAGGYLRHNPGNLRLSSFQLGTNNGFAVFENDLVGFLAIVHQLYLYASGHSIFVPPNDTIADAIALYSGLDHNSLMFQNYISIIEKVGGVTKADKISSIL